MSGEENRTAECKRLETSIAEKRRVEEIGTEYSREEKSRRDWNRVEKRRVVKRNRRKEMSCLCARAKKSPGMFLVLWE